MMELRKKTSLRTIYGLKLFRKVLLLDKIFLCIIGMKNSKEIEFIYDRYPKLWVILVLERLMAVFYTKLSYCKVCGWWLWKVTIRMSWFCGTDTSSHTHLSYFLHLDRNDISEQNYPSLKIHNYKVYSTNQDSTIQTSKSKVINVYVQKKCIKAVHIKKLCNKLTRKD